MKQMERIDRLRAELANDDYSAIVIPSNDPHFGEYIPDRYKTIQWLSGFTGEAATLVITQKKAAIWIDSRFFISGEQELRGTGIEIMKLKVEGTPTIAGWLKSQLDEDDIVVMDENLFTYGEYTGMLDDLAPMNVALIPDPMDAVWTDRPTLQFNPIRIMDESVCGESVKSKHQRLTANLESHLGGEKFAYIITVLDEIAWLCNIRGTDVEYNPLVLSYAIVTEKEITLFLRQEMLSEEAIRSLCSQGVILRDYEEIGRALSSLPTDLVRIFSSDRVTACNFLAATESVNSDFPMRRAADPTVGGTLNRMKAVKNEVELAGFRRAFIEDGKAMVKVIGWVKENAGKGITEYDVAQKLIECRSECPDYLGESFPAIVAVGANAAAPHYMPPANGSAPIPAQGLILIDTGGQYTYGTTDTTRMIPLGSQPQEIIDDYTAVLKGMVDLSRAVFRKGTRGCQLDILARGPVMAQGRMYMHGTSHGLGHALCVHEGPQSIRMEENPVPLEAGCVLSNEPAMYLEGSHGIRHENVVAVVPAFTTGSGEFYRFETLTVTPVDMSAVNYDMLDAKEIAWLEDFNARFGKL